jgi:hypothetical protein
VLRERKLAQTTDARGTLPSDRAPSRPVGTGKGKCGWLTGFEPATPSATNWCSNQLSYSHHTDRLADDRGAGILPSRSATVNVADEELRNDSKTRLNGVGHRATLPALAVERSAGNAPL